MRFLGIGIGHRDQFIRSDSEVGTEADLMSNELCDEVGGADHDPTIEGEENDSNLNDQEDGNEEGRDEIGRASCRERV